MGSAHVLELRECATTGSTSARTAGNMSSDENPTEDDGSIPVGLDMLIDRGQSRRQDPSQLRLIMTMVSKKPKWSLDPYH